MAYCTHCGGQIPPDASFCPYCGQPAAQQITAGDPAPVVPAEPVTLSEPAPVVPAQPVTVSEPTPVMPAYSAPDYSLVLVSLGTCRRTYADDVLQDIMGYSAAEAKLIVRQVPVQIAQSLTIEQAQYIAQALTEYGMQVAIYLGSEPIDLGQRATSSVFNSDGSLIGAALAAIAAVSVSNRMNRFVRWQRPSLLDVIFRPRYHAPEPPRHVRRQIRRQIRRDPVIRRDPAPRVDRSPRAIERSEPVRTGGFADKAHTGSPGLSRTAGSRAAGAGMQQRQAGPGGQRTGGGGSRPGGQSGGRPGGRR